MAPQLARAIVAAEERDAETDTLLASLSRREAEVLSRIAQGRAMKDVAVALSLSPRTLETYKARAMNKLNLSSRSELVRCAVRFGWLPGD